MIRTMVVVRIAWSLSNLATLRAPGTRGARKAQPSKRLAVCSRSEGAIRSPTLGPMVAVRIVTDARAVPGSSPPSCLERHVEGVSHLRSMREAVLGPRRARGGRGLVRAVGSPTRSSASRRRAMGRRVTRGCASRRGLLRARAERTRPERGAPGRRPGGRPGGFRRHVVQRESPRRSARRRPPAPMNAAIVAVPTATTALVLMPARICPRRERELDVAQALPTADRPSASAASRKLGPGSRRGRRACFARSAGARDT